MSVSTSLYEPSKWQIRYHNTPHRTVLGAGSAGPGKTYCLINDPNHQIIVEHARVARQPWLPLSGKRRWADHTKEEKAQLEQDSLFQLIHKNPLKKGWSTGYSIYLRRITSMLEPSLRDAQKLLPALDPDVKWTRDSSGSHTAQFSSGYRSKYTHCKDKDGWQTHYSAAYQHIAFDEANQFTEEQVNQISSRLRSDDPVLDRMKKIRMMSNPTMLRGKGEDFSQDDPFWLRRKFVDPWPAGNRTFRQSITLSDGSSRDNTWIYLPARLSDNPNKDFALSYEFSLRTLPKRLQRALLDGDWYVQEGSFFGDVWDRDVHVHPVFRIPDDWKVFRSLDWGFKTHGCVHWWAIDHDGNLWCFEELSFLGKTDVEVADEIRAIEEAYGLWEGHKSGITGPADTSLWEERGSRGMSKAHVMGMKGVHWLQADKRSRQRNAELMHSRLKEVVDGVASMMVFERCRMLCRTIPAIISAKANQNEPEKGGEDHWVDSAMYACAHASRDPRTVGRTTASVEDEFWRQDEAAPYDAGYDGYGGVL